MNTRMTGMKKCLIGLVILIIVVLLTAGCTQTSPQGPATQSPTSSPTVTATYTTTPTDVIPVDQAIIVEASKSTLSFDPKIKVEFRGGSGMNIISYIDVKVTRSDGTVETARMTSPDIGAFVELTGTTGTDRVEVTYRLQNGNEYKAYDQVFEFRK
jgi:ABC-type Fe3+-hydroxamate transport system substrate-binding protein